MNAIDTDTLEDFVLRARRRLTAGIELLETALDLPVFNNSKESERQGDLMATAQELFRSVNDDLKYLEDIPASISNWRPGENANR